ncbi:MAG TPA: VanZ family protein, partial [Tepidisphaeraceae bacterium]|nr:VanZ family protein [Tepidisphaeraceae bacterium]
MTRSLRLLKPLVWTALAVHWITIFVLTHLPAKKLPKVPVNDKIEHSTAYIVLAVLLYASLRLLRPRMVLWWIVLLNGMIYGAADEYLQYALPINRDASVGDWTADVVGTAIGVIVASAAASALLRQ